MRRGCTLITPRETHLLRAPTLRAFQRAIVDQVTGCIGASRPAAVLIPTRAASGQLRRTLAAAGVGRGQAALVTRSEWYEWLLERYGACPPLLTAVQRQVVGTAAAGDARADGCVPPFRLRPGIVAALLAFYDQLRRQRRSVDAFERLLLDELEPSAELDRGARRLLLQTRFLVAAFRAYDRRLDTLGRVDEHRLRERLLAAEPLRRVSEIVVTVPDHVAHAAGLYPADFDLLARLPRLERVTVIATDGVLDSGFRERLDDLLPGLTESRAQSDGGRPAVVVVPDSSAERPYFVWRDREEELRGIARQVRRGVAVDGCLPAAAAVVVQRPLPYLYLAPSAFAAAAQPVRPGDALPLAVAPYAAAVDLVLAFAASGFDRGPTVELLRSPHFRFETDAPPPASGAIRALDRALSELRFSGGLELLSSYAAEWAAAAGTRRGAAGALRCVLALAEQLRPLLQTRPLAAQLETLRSFLQRHASPLDTVEPAGRAGEGRALVWQGLEALEAANRSLDGAGGAVDVAGVASVVRRWIESRTLPAGAPAEGVHLLDVQAAVYGRFDDVFVAVSSRPNGPGARPATSSIRAVSWQGSAGRASATACEPLAPRSAICSDSRPSASGSPPSLWRTMRSWPPRRCSRTSTASPSSRSRCRTAISPARPATGPGRTRTRTSAGVGGPCASRGRSGPAPAVRGRPAAPGANRSVRTPSARWSGMPAVPSSTSRLTRSVSRRSARPSGR